MSDLEKIRNWLETYPKIAAAKGLKVDYYAEQTQESSIAPAGLQEISRSEDILGNVTVQNQLNFALYFVFDKSPDDDVGATENAEWLLELQQWVQQQSILRKIPAFGDEPGSETVKAQNGELTYANIDGTGIYTVLLSINYTKKYEV